MLLSKVIDYFRPIKEHQDQLAIWKDKILISFLLAFLIIVFAMWITTVVGLSTDIFPFLPMGFALVGMLFFFKKTGNRSLVINFTLAAMFSATIFISFETGAVYSYNLRWMVFPILLSFLFLDIKFGIFWTLIAITSLTYNFYIVEEEHINQAMELGSLNYFMDNLMFLLVFAFLFSVFYYTQHKLSKELNEKNNLLEQQKRTLKLKTEELNIVTNKLQETNLNLERYAHSTAHDLKQPVRSISSFAQLVKKDVDKKMVGEKTSSYLEFVINSSKQLTETINNLLSFAKADYEGASNLELVCLTELVRSVETLLSTQIKEADAEIQCDSLPIVSIHKSQIECLFQNLISNAVKFSKVNEKSIIKIECEEKENEYLISIFDNGIGIKEENLSKIFKAFEQINESKFTGVGIGLSNCKSIIENHNGKIWVESEFGSFTTFKFTLPK